MISCNCTSQAGSDEMRLPMCGWFSSSSIVDFIAWLRVCTLESTLVMFIFPGTSLTSLKWNVVSPILNLWIVDGSWSSVAVLKSGTRGFWSVSTEIDLSTMYFQDHLHAHVSAGAFSSILAYLVLVGVIARNMTKTGLQDLYGWSWRILHFCTRSWISGLRHGQQTEFFARLWHNWFLGVLHGYFPGFQDAWKKGLQTWIL